MLIYSGSRVFFKSQMTSVDNESDQVSSSLETLTFYFHVNEKTVFFLQKHDGSYTCILSMHRWSLSSINIYTYVRLKVHRIQFSEKNEKVHNFADMFSGSPSVAVTKLFLSLVLPSTSLVITSCSLIFCLQLLSLLVFAFLFFGRNIDWTINTLLNFF